MSSSAEGRRTAIASGGSHKRVAGSRRRPTPDRPAVRDEAVDVLEPGTASKEDVTCEEQVVDGVETRRRRLATRRFWPAALAAGAALILLVTTLAVSLRPVMSDSDRAAAVESARTTLESLLSYSGANFDAHVTEVTPRLVAPFKDQFTKVAATDIKPMAVKNGATVRAKVYDAGVMDTTGNGGDGSTARIMAFVNQATTTAKQPTPAIDQNRVIVTMKRVGQRWLVSDLAAF